MSTNGVYVGLDVHKDSIVIAVAREGRAAAEEWKTIPYDGVRLRKALKMLVKDGETLKVCYEAGPTGFGDLERARDDAKRAERVARHQGSKFLLRHDRHGEGTTWTRRPRDWIRSQKFAYPAQQRVLEDSLKTVEDLAERVERLTAQVEELVQETALAPLVKALQAFRGVSVASAVTIAAEAGDLRRFATASQLMSYVGLVPSEDSSGKRRRQGTITRCGNGHLRRILVEAAWHDRHVPRMSKELRRRNQGLAPGVQRLAWEAQKRLHHRLDHLLHAGKSVQKTITALARELAGFLWAVGQEEQWLEVT